jgi:hypothetical protein
MPLAALQECEASSGEEIMNNSLPELWRLDARVILFPVRHHSPAAARLVCELIERVRPSHVLVEGPSDFNDQLDELWLSHQLPIAIYSYLCDAGGVSRSAYYPFCEHSPEWQAMQTAHQLGITTRFIDLPWSDVAREEGEPANRYSDGDLLRSRYLERVCHQLGVDDIHTLWDTLFELDGTLSLENYLRRCHEWCGHSRLLEGVGRLMDRRREAFMASMIRQALSESNGRIVVVTGGYHSLALHARLNGGGPAGIDDPAECPLTPLAAGQERGISLTPYSFERLDSLSGYDAGMPNPGFYQRVWLDRKEGRSDTWVSLLTEIAKRLRVRSQTVSAADLIAAETTARALASMRGHSEVWRNDLVDGLTAAIIKDDLAVTGKHPLLEAIHEVLRGGERGQLDARTRQPPLLRDVQNQLSVHALEPQNTPREVDLELTADEGRNRSRVLHQLKLLAIPGFDLVAGSDFEKRDDLARVWERWKISASFDFTARCIESARYGSSLLEAATGKLDEESRAIERDAGKAALLLLQAALAGLLSQAVKLFERVRELVRSDADFFSVTAALRHLLYLFKYDAALQTAGQADIGELLKETYAGGLWLLESLGQVSGRDQEILDGIGSLRETFERCESLLDFDRAELTGVLHRVGCDRGQTPLVRGATLGARWSLGDADGDQALAAMRLFVDPNQFGDFLTGLFALAREQVQRQPDLVLGIHQAIAAYSVDDFLLALPSLRLAFTYFTPREKHYLAQTLRRALGLEQEPEMSALAVDPATVAQALVWEERLFTAVEKYGLQGRTT